MSKAEIAKAHSRASQLKYLIGELKQQLDKLKQETVKKLCAEEEKKIILENEHLKSEVIQLRNKLCELEMKHNKKQVPLPSNLNSCKTSLVLEEKSKLPQQKLEMPKCSVPTANNEIKDKNVKKKENNVDKKSAGVAKHESKAAATGAEDTVDASRLNMRIGRIVDVSKHPDADSLYVESVDVGESKPRTIVSGLVNHVPIEQMRDRLAVFLLNLKPAKMRGVLSEGMIMCASTPEKVEVICVPDGVMIGERVTVEGYEGEPDEQLNPKKKIWEQIQPDLKINSDGFATYKGNLWKDEKGNRFKAPTMNDCPIK